MSAATRRGVVPSDLRQRIDRLTDDFSARILARLLAGQLDGLAPTVLREDELRDLGPELGLLTPAAR